MTVSYTGPLRNAVQRMRRILFQPFDLATWVTIGFSAFLAGLVDGNMGSGGSVSDDQSWEDIADGIDSAVSGGIETLIASAVAVAVVAFILLFVLAIVAICLWLSSRAKFMFLDNVVTERGQIKAPWSEYRREGNSLFWWRLGFLVVTTVVVLGVAAIALVFLVPRGDPFAETGSIAVFVISLLILLTIGLVYAFISLLVENFLIPIMYHRRLSATEAWTVLLPLVKERLAEFILYALFVLVLFIGIGVVVAIGGLLTCCIGFLILAIPYVGSVFSLPVTVSYRAFSLEFLGQFGSEYWAEPERVDPEETDPASGGASPSLPPPPGT